MRDFVMTGFRSGDLDNELTVDDRIEIFKGILPGASDLTVDLFNQVLNDYFAGFAVEKVVEETWRIDYMYRCGGNYKDFYSVVTSDPKAQFLNKEDYFLMGEYGTPTQEEYFTEHPYDPSLDHNILEVVCVRPVLEFSDDQIVVLVEEHRGKYSIEFVDAITGEPYLDATKMVDGLQKYEVAIKSYSENEGVREFLEKHGIISPVKRIVNAGFAELSIHDVQGT